MNSMFFPCLVFFRTGWRDAKHKKRCIQKLIFLAVTDSHCFMCLVARMSDLFDLFFDLTTRCILCCWVCVPSYSLYHSVELMFLETSALTGENVEESFLKCARTILNKIDTGMFHSGQLQLWVFCYGNSAYCSIGMLWGTFFKLLAGIHLRHSVLSCWVPHARCICPVGSQLCVHSCSSI